MLLAKLQKSLQTLKNPAKAKIYAGFFKTAPGQYGHGDIFLGLTAPQQRAIAKQFYNLSLVDIQTLLKSKIHEERLTALVILVRQFISAARHYLPLTKGEPAEGVKTQKQIFNFYLKNAKRINNWDLVDTSAPHIVGACLVGKPPDILYKLARSKNLWERRIAIVATFAFIRANRLDETLKITKLLLNDKHDLIHKACGWMLREVGKKSQVTLKKFLNRHAHKMPRTMLRYAIEKFSPTERQRYLKK